MSVINTYIEENHGAILLIANRRFGDVGVMLVTNTDLHQEMLSLLTNKTGYEEKFKEWRWFPYAEAQTVNDALTILENKLYEQPSLDIDWSYRVTAIMTAAATGDLPH